MLVLKHKKSAAVQQRFTLVYSSKKATCTFGVGGCFFNAFVSTIYVPFVKFPICITSNNTGSSQNVPTLAKGEPLTVLAAPTFIIRYRGLFSYEFLQNKYTKFSMLKLAIFTDLDFVHFNQVPYC